MRQDNRQIALEIIEHSPSLAIRVSVREGRWKTYFVTENIATYGYTREEFMSGSVTWMDLVHRDDVDGMVKQVQAHLAKNIDTFNIVYRLVKKNGLPVWISDTTTVIRAADGTPLYFDCVIADHTETKENIEKIEDNYRQQAILNEILHGLHDPNLDKPLEIILDRTGLYLDISRAILFEDAPDHATCRAIYEWCNVGVPSILEQGEYVIDYENDISEVAKTLRECGRQIVDCGRIPPKSSAEFDREGVIASAVFAITIADEPFGFICFDECRKPRQWQEDTVRFLDNVARLVSPALVRKKNEQVLRNMALTDQLTGLNNRYHLETRLNDAIAKSRICGRSGFVLFIDMDDFKVINDGYGHDYGDVILKEFADFLKTHFRDGSEIFRFGGDEFVILLDPERSDNVYAVINGLRARAQLPWTVMDKSFYCTLSIGIVRFPEGCGDGREIIKNADIAMYQAKKMGKNNYVFYTHTLDNDSIARAEIEKAMRESIDAGFSGFEPYYQPLVDSAGGIVGAEALLRWTLADGRAISPAQFIPLSEYLGLIVPLGDFVLRSASRLCRTVNGMHPDFLVSVNASIRQFQRQNFLEETLRALREEGVPPSNLVLEITESLAMQDIQRMRILAEEFSKNGVRIAMDDFGTGYSSLGNMRELPVDVVKIDRSFITDVVNDAYAKSFIRLITDLVHSMGRKICIEGAETSLQLKHCLEFGADYIQGYHLAKPIPEAELLELVLVSDPNLREQFENSRSAPLLAPATREGARGGTRFFARPERATEKI